VFVLFLFPVYVIADISFWLPGHVFASFYFMHLLGVKWVIQ